MVHSSLLCDSDYVMLYPVGHEGAIPWIVHPCLTLLGLVESVHGHHSTKLIGHLPLINRYEPTFDVAETDQDMWGT